MAFLEIHIKKMIRLIDLFIVVLAGIIFLIPIAVIAIVIKLTSVGPILFWSKRVGKNNSIFLMPKFRTMLIDTPVTATHLLNNPRTYLTPIGNFLRRTSLDELPQLWSIFKGEMAIVGPRPALFNQHDLLALRNKFGIDALTPGLTGWAQINGRDNLTIHEKVQLEVEYLEQISILFNLKIIGLTIIKVLTRDAISH